MWGYVGIIPFWLQVNFHVFINTLYSIQRVYNVFSSIVHFMKHMSCWASSCFYKCKISYYYWGLIIYQTLCLRALHNLSHWSFTLALWVRNYPHYVHKETETQRDYRFPLVTEWVSEFNLRSTWHQDLCSSPAFCSAWWWTNVHL